MNGSYLASSLLRKLYHNTSAFNYRNVFDSDKLSNHSYGRAVDINPLINPYVTKEGTTRPAGLSYDPAAKGSIVVDDETVRLFLERGWEGGGHWEVKYGYADYQHFEKMV